MNLLKNFTLILSYFLKSILKKHSAIVPKMESMTYSSNSPIKEGSIGKWPGRKSGKFPPKHLIDLSHTDSSPYRDSSVPLLKK
ncbi:hypothetical protein CSA56_10350 [candidate division KSB3 bacterium]|uniref:Uncharacterized protein n=1 Tax=candidate division KSB3 bacterium TaxID=2044937 RepID=A0A2G6KDH5_9BACT|nr:MAG: hypothetical protein CSA56_10350 [candidate division KSB3 bacterium]